MTFCRDHGIDSFIENAHEALARGHVLVIDLFPPEARSAGRGGHVVIRRGFGKEVTEIEMPLFLTPTWYVNVPLEETYQAAYRGVPRKWRAVLDAP